MISFSASLSTPPRLPTDSVAVRGSVQASLLPFGVRRSELGVCLKILPAPPFRSPPRFPAPPFPVHDVGLRFEIILARYLFGVCFDSLAPVRSLAALASPNRSTHRPPGTACSISCFACRAEALCAGGSAFPVRRWTNSPWRASSPAALAGHSAARLSSLHNRPNAALPAQAFSCFLRWIITAIVLPC